MLPSQLANSAIKLPKDVYDALVNWDLEGLKKSLTTELAQSIVYVQDDWTYPSPMFLFIFMSNQSASKFWKSEGKICDPRPFLDVFLEKGSSLDWHPHMMPEDSAQFRSVFKTYCFEGPEEREWEELFSTFRAALDHHMAEILVPYFLDKGALIHLPSEKNPTDAFQAFLDGIFFNPNVGDFKNQNSPEALNILTLLQVQGCFSMEMVEQELKKDPTDPFAIYWQTFEDKQLKIKLTSELDGGVIAKGKNKL